MRLFIILWWITCRLWNARSTYLRKLNKEKSSNLSLKKNLRFRIMCVNWPRKCTMCLYLRCWILRLCLRKLMRMLLIEYLVNWILSMLLLCFHLVNNLKILKQKNTWVQNTSFNLYHNVKNPVYNFTPSLQTRSSQSTQPYPNPLNLPH